MKLINTSEVDFTFGGVTIAAGQTSENIDDIQARQIAARAGGMIAIAPESAHTPEELAKADEKKTEPPVPPEPPVEPEPTSGAAARRRENP
jgi:hypothetical protein